MSVKDFLRHFKRAVLRRAETESYPHRAGGTKVAIANYKCGFTSMNRCLPKWDKRIDDGEHLRRYLAGHPGLEVHMIVRDPVVRFQSFVHGWFVDKGPVFFERRQKREISNFAYDNLVRLGGQEAAQEWRISSRRPISTGSIIFSRMSFPSIATSISMSTP